MSVSHSIVSTPSAGALPAALIVAIGGALIASVATASSVDRPSNQFPLGGFEDTADEPISRVAPFDFTGTGILVAQAPVSDEEAFSQAPSRVIQVIQYQYEDGKVVSADIVEHPVTDEES